jgi:hypothetical protein
MDLGDYIELLQKQDPNKEVKNGLGNPHSWRGSYDEVAFEPVGKTTFGEMLKDAENALGNTYFGYKGGEFVMTPETEVNVDRAGQYSDGFELENMTDAFNVPDPDRLEHLINLMAKA